MNAPANSAASVALAVLAVRIEDDGPMGVSSFSTKFEPTICRAVRRLIKSSVFTRVDAPRGELAVKAGPAY